jgi:Family of unknown function (DUF6588)
MRPRFRTSGALTSAAALSFLLATAALAEDGAVQNQISVYTGDNAVGYLQPLANAFGAALNSSFGYTAYIPKSSFHISLEAPVMGVFFEDADRTFEATTESGFQPTTKYQKAPTVVGPGEAEIITGTGGATFAFPGGLDLNSFGLVVPQVRVSALLGTEAVIRWIAFESGDADVGKIDLFGIGGRHSLSQYMGETPPLDLAVGALWQTFDVGDNFVSTDALAIQLQASKRAPIGFMVLEPYAMFGWERLDADVSYDGPGGAAEHISLEGSNDVRFTLGAGLNFVAGQVWADYNFASVNSFSFGLALGNVGRP